VCVCVCVCVCVYAYINNGEFIEVTDLVTKPIMWEQSGELICSCISDLKLTCL
jgi:hypothetical protein